MDEYRDAWAMVLVPKTRDAISSARSHIVMRNTVPASLSLEWDVHKFCGSDNDLYVRLVYSLLCHACAPHKCRCVLYCAGDKLHAR